MKSSSLRKEDGAVLLMIVIVTMILLTIGTTMLLVNSNDSAIIKPVEREAPPIVVPDPPTGGRLIPNENDGADDDFPGAEDWGFAYVNFDPNLGYGTPDSPVPDLTQDLTTTGMLIIPPSVGQIVVQNNNLTYHADQGIYFGMSLEADKGTSALTLGSDSGVIKIAKSTSDIDIKVFKKITVTNTGGSIKIEPGVDIRTIQNQGDITLSAGQDVILRGAILDSSSCIYLTAGSLGTGDLDLSQANLDADENITMNGDTISMDDAYLTSGGSITVNGDEVNLSKVNLIAGGNITIIGDNINLSGATLSAGGSITVTTSGIIAANTATLGAVGSIYITASTLIDLRNASLTAGGNKQYITLTLTGGTSTNKAQILVDNARFNKTASVTNTNLNTITITGSPAGTYNTNPASPYP